MFLHKSYFIWEYSHNYGWEIAIYEIHSLVLSSHKILHLYRIVIYLTYACDSATVYRFNKWIYLFTYLEQPEWLPLSANT